MPVAGKYRLIGGPIKAASFAAAVHDAVTRLDRQLQVAATAPPAEVDTWPLASEENVAWLLRKGQGLLRLQLQAVGLPLGSAFPLREEPSCGRFSVGDMQPDRELLETAINRDPALVRALHDACALARQIPAARADAHFANAWANAANDVQRTALLDYHRALADSMRCEIVLCMGPDGLCLTLNGERIRAAVV